MAVPSRPSGKYTSEKALGIERGKVLGSGLPCGCAAGKVLAKA